MDDIVYRSMVTAYTASAEKPECHPLLRALAEEAGPSFTNDFQKNNGASFIADSRKSCFRFELTSDLNTGLVLGFWDLILRIVKRYNMQDPWSLFFVNSERAQNNRV